MKPEFSIIDLVSIFIEKIYYFISLIIIVIICAWYLNSISTPKYRLHHTSYHLDYYEQEKLLNLSLLKFYTKGIHSNTHRGLLYLNQNDDLRHTILMF